MDFEIHTLQNGIRVIHKRTDSPVAHCSIMINAGTRDELEHEHGIAHFIEHVVFKGTKKRKAYHIMSRLEDVGGELNAYTTKEETVIHATFLKDDFDRAVELIADITFRSTFPDKEIKKEKEVVLDEINSYKDNPSELIFDDFEELIYNGHPFGLNILGTKKDIKRFTRADIQSFIERNYNTDQIVFCSIGNISFNRVQKLAERHLGWVAPNKRKIQRDGFRNYTPHTKIVKKSTFQTHCVIGNIAYDLQEPKRIGMHLLNNILGGPGLNSRLNLALREKHGYAYNIESMYNPYSDTGLFCIYFGTDKGNLDKSMALINKELDRIMAKKLGVLQLFKAKRQLMGQLAIASDSNESLMLSVAKSFMVYNTADSLEVIYAQIENLTSANLLDIANDILNPNKLSTLIYK
ncbi:MAG: insulinase family protein [Bacteroidales bacterium]|nr:MAG: insulinase family protein [Bacteroidales bacterium]